LDAPKTVHPLDGSGRSFLEDAGLQPANWSVMNESAQPDFVRVFSTLHERLPRNRLFSKKPVNEQTARDKDAELLQRIGAMDRSAFAEFYDKYSALLFSIACRILNDASEAEDVLQETFIQIWEKAGDFNPKLGKASTWAGILVRNKAIDRVRASQRRARMANEAGVEYAVAAEVQETANGVVHGREKAKLIQSALVKLPSEQRRAIEMAFFSGLTQNEISEQLKEPLGTIKARIRRGMLSLRDRLEDLL
jgi:RNA polymerase sigma-70 factor (ECF subfamily)